MSPSEEKGRALGIGILSYERNKRTTEVSGKLVTTNVYARFEVELLDGKTGKRRHYLHSFSKSRAGAWRHAIRWLRQLERGRLR